MNLGFSDMVLILSEVQQYIMFILKYTMDPTHKPCFEQKING